MMHQATSFDRCMMHTNVRQGNEKVRREFRSLIDSYTFNGKIDIGCLTEAAERYTDYPADVAFAIQSYFMTLPLEEKILPLYLVDCITKQIGAGYRTAFGQTIIEMTCYLFKKGDRRMKSKLWELRRTWENVFINTKLNLLDLKINAFDPKWPVVGSHQNTAVVCKDCPLYKDIEF